MFEVLAGFFIIFSAGIFVAHGLWATIRMMARSEVTRGLAFRCPDRLAVAVGGLRA